MPVMKPEREPDRPEVAVAVCADCGHTCHFCGAPATFITSRSWVYVCQPHWLRIQERRRQQNGEEIT